MKEDFNSAKKAPNKGNEDRDIFIDLVAEEQKIKSQNVDSKSQKTDEKKDIKLSSRDTSASAVRETIVRATIDTNNLIKDVKNANKERRRRTLTKIGTAIVTGALVVATGVGVYQLSKPERIQKTESSKEISKAEFMEKIQDEIMEMKKAVLVAKFNEDPETAYHDSINEALNQEKTKIAEKNGIEDPLNVWINVKVRESEDEEYNISIRNTAKASDNIEINNEDRENIMKIIEFQNLLLDDNYTLDDYMKLIEMNDYAEADKEIERIEKEEQKNEEEIIVLPPKEEEER